MVCCYMELSKSENFQRARISSALGNSSGAHEKYALGEDPLKCEKHRKQREKMGLSYMTTICGYFHLAAAKNIRR